MEDATEWKQLRMLVRSVQEAVLNASATVDLIEEQAPFFRALHAASHFLQPTRGSTTDHLIGEDDKTKQVLGEDEVEE
jgi:hypothetical protein